MKEYMCTIVSMKFLSAMLSCTVGGGDGMREREREREREKERDVRRSTCEEDAPYVCLLESVLDHGVEVWVISGSIPTVLEATNHQLERERGRDRETETERQRERQKETKREERERERILVACS